MTDTQRGPHPRLAGRPRTFGEIHQDHTGLENSIGVGPLRSSRAGILELGLTLTNPLPNWSPSPILRSHASYSAPAWPRASSSSSITVTFTPFGVPSEDNCNKGDRRWVVAFHASGRETGRLILGPGAAIFLVPFPYLRWRVFNPIYHVRRSSGSPMVAAIGLARYWSGRYKTPSSVASGDGIEGNALVGRDNGETRGHTAADARCRRCCPCPNFETQPFVVGPPLAQRRLAIVSSAALIRRGDQPFHFGVPSVASSRLPGPRLTS